MRRYLGLVLHVLLLAGALALASCGGSGGGQGDANKQGGGGMAGMDHGSDGSMGAMDSGPMAAQEMVMVDGEYSDEAFIDSMVPHHRGAVGMAEAAIVNAEHPEIRTLAEEIVSAQEAEIQELRAIKEEEYGTPKVARGMDASRMEAMGMTDPQALADKRPFDKAFIDAMIPHHESAIEMAGVAVESSENPRIREIAEGIVEAQEKEIAQMREWREDWYPEG